MKSLKLGERSLAPHARPWIKY